jgi:hypothetical protein
MNRDLKTERAIAIAEQAGGLRPRKLRQPRAQPKRSNSADTTRWLRQAEAEAREQAEAERLLGDDLDDLEEYELPAPLIDDDIDWDVPEPKDVTEWEWQP